MSMTELLTNTFKAFACLAGLALYLLAVVTCFGYADDAEKEMKKWEKNDPRKKRQEQKQTAAIILGLLLVLLGFAFVIGLAMTV